MYSRRIDDTVYSFGHEGVLYRRSFIMYDRQTDSLWIHTTGECVKGKMKGKVLSFLPSTVTSWKRWKALHPNTLVLTGRRANNFMGRFGFAEEPEKYGLSIGQGPKPTLVPFAVLMKAHVVNLTHDGEKIVVAWDKESATAHAYERGERTFAWKDGALRDAKGRAWDPLRGTTVEKPIERMDQVPGTTWLVERWRGFHPRCPVFEAKDAK